MSDVRQMISDLLNEEIDKLKYGNKIKLAEDIGISYFTMHDICNGTRDIRSGTIDLILEHFGKHMEIVDD